MAEWTDLDDFTIGETLRAADLNTILDNLDFLYEKPACAVRKTATQSINNASDTTVVWDQAVWDSTGQMWDAGSPSKVNIVRDGVYSIVCAVLWQAFAEATPSKRAAFLTVNGTRRRGIQVPSTSPAELILVSDTTLGDGDSIDVQVRQTSGEALTVEPTRTVMTVRWVAKLPTASEIW